jgi:hypothetical protein
VVRGHNNYFGVPLNFHAIDSFRWKVGLLWRKALGRRSQRAEVPWERMERLIGCWLPPARICHPLPLVRLGVVT